MLAVEIFSIAKRFDGDTLLLSPSLFYTKKKAFVKFKSEQKMLNYSMCFIACSVLNQ